MGARAASSGLAVARRAPRQPLCNRIHALCGLAAELTVKPVAISGASRPETNIYSTNFIYKAFGETTTEQEAAVK